MDSYIVSMLNKASWTLEARITDLEEKLQRERAESQKWMDIALKGAQQGAMNILNTIITVQKNIEDDFKVNND